MGFEPGLHHFLILLLSLFHIISCHIFHTKLMRKNCRMPPCAFCPVEGTKDHYKQVEYHHPFYGKLSPIGLNTWDTSVVSTNLNMYFKFAQDDSFISLRVDVGVNLCGFVYKCVFGWQQHQISRTNDLACLSEARRSCRQRLVPRAMRPLTKHNCCSTRPPHIWFTRAHATMEMRWSSNRQLPLTFISLPVNKQLAFSSLNFPLILGPLTCHFLHHWACLLFISLCLDTDTAECHLDVLSPL